LDIAVIDEIWRVPEFTPVDHIEASHAPTENFSQTTDFVFTPGE
jgi:hypothetical protein